jgi:hypothetical protein
MLIDKAIPFSVNTDGVVGTLKYRQPGLLRTSRNFAQIQKMLGKKYLLVLRLPLRHS